MKTSLTTKIQIHFRGVRCPIIEETMNQLIYPLIVLLVTTVVSGQVLPAERAFTTTWQNAGYTGNIVPGASVDVQDFGAVGDGITDDTLAIDAAIDFVFSSPAHGTVFFPAGEYLITATLQLPSGCSLRGEVSAGENQSRLIFNFNGSDGDCLYVGGTVTSTYQMVWPQLMHSQSLVILDASLFSIGDHIELRQDNDPQWDNGDQWASQAVGQIEEIAAIDGNTITLRNELRADYLEIYNPVVRRIAPVLEVGIDNLIIERVDGTSPVYGDHIHFNLAANCWVRGVEFIRCVQRFVHLTSSSNISVTGCYFHHAFEYGGGGHAYGIECSSQTGACLLQDNVFEHLRHSMLIQNGGNGNVFGYNFSTDPYRDEWPHDYASDIAFHGNRGFGNLVEGNIVHNLIFDGSHGEPAGPYNTVFRNQAELYGVLITTACDNQNIIGNDITDGFFGQYSLAGANHQEWANRESGLFGGVTVHPSGTTELADRSYYLNLDGNVPAFWTIDQMFPAIGTGSSSSFSEGTNPARERYISTNILTVPAPECLRHGDINASGSITAQDVQLAFFAVLGLATLSTEQECAADCDGNGENSANDCSRLFELILYGTPCAN